MKISLAGLIASYAAAMGVMIMLDLIWLGVIAKDWYLQSMGHLLAPEPNLVAAMLFYAVFPLGLMMFVVMPHAATPSLSRLAFWGGAFGFFTYATYDLTNLSVLKDYPANLAMLDMAWGTAISAAAAMAGKMVHDQWISDS